MTLELACFHDSLHFFCAYSNVLPRKKITGKMRVRTTLNMAQALDLSLKSEHSPRVVEVSHLYNFKLHHLGVIESLLYPAPLLLVKLNLLIRAH